MEPMRLDPEDYAFLASYSPQRVRKLAVRLGAACKGRLLSVVIGLAFTVYLWFRMGKPQGWTGVTGTVLGLFVAGFVLVVASGVVAGFRAGTSGRGTGLVLHGTVLLGGALPLVGLWFVWVKIHGLLGLVDDAGGSPGWFKVVVWTWCALLGVLALVWVAAAVLTAIWARQPRSLGWIARQLSQAAAVAGFAAVFATALGLVAVRKWVNGLDESVIAASGWMADLAMWGLMAWMVLTIVLVAVGALQAADAIVFAGTLVAAPALRVDPLGLVIDDAGRPTRVTWPQVNALLAKAHSPQPGPELWLKRHGGPDWLVPLGFLDCLPGSIDSAIRAHTGNRRTLDVARLSRIW